MERPFIAVHGSQGIAHEDGTEFVADQEASVAVVVCHHCAVLESAALFVKLREVLGVTHHEQVLHRVVNRRDDLHLVVEVQLRLRLQVYHADGAVVGV